MGIYLRCRCLQSGAVAQADSGGWLMAKDPACGRGWIMIGTRAGSSATFTYTMAIQASFANAAEFFNSLLGYNPLDRPSHHNTAAARWPFYALERHTYFCGQN